MLKKCHGNCLFMKIVLLIMLFASIKLYAEENVYLNFDEIRNSENVKFYTQFEMHGQTEGVFGKSWRSDGFSSYIEISRKTSENGIYIDFWVALESYPSDYEVVPSELNPSSFINQRSDKKGFDIFIDTYGRWGLWVGLDNSTVTLSSKENFPLYQWVRVTTIINKDEAILKLNGDVIASSSFENGNEFQPSDSTVLVAKPQIERQIIDVFDINRINAAYDELVIADIKDQSFHKTIVDISQLDASVSLNVPSSRFKNDHLRPKHHGMPPANWTNEPHGMVKKNDTYHLFYQRTPNGPYKTQMHWGHMISKDLVNWKNIKDALRPELQDEKFGWDQKGIWSGDVIVEGDMGIAFYTSVNHYDRLTAFNPGISMATSTDPLLENWTKHGPIINTKHVSDFRDPYIFKKGSTLHMLIGAAYKKNGGLDYWVWDKEKTNSKWKHKKRFSSLSYQRMDIGSIIWEMPVFEPLEDNIHVLVVNPIGGAVDKYGDLATRAIYWTGEWNNGLFVPHYTDGKLLDLLPGHLSPTVERGPDGDWRAIGIVDERRTPEAQRDAGWAHTFSFPRRWYLMPDKRTLGQAPAPELELLRDELVVNLKDHNASEKLKKLLHTNSPYEIQVKTETLNSKLTLRILASEDAKEYAELHFDPISNTIMLDKTQSNLSGNDEGPLVLEGSYDSLAFGKMNNVRLYVDGSIVEVFINNAAAFSVRIYPSEPTSNGVYIKTDSEEVLSEIKIWTQK